MKTSTLLTGTKEAIRVLACEHKIPTGMSMRLFRTPKGARTECPQGCGEQKTIRVEGGKTMTADQFVASVRFR